MIQLLLYVDIAVGNSAFSSFTLQINRFSFNLNYGGTFEFRGNPNFDATFSHSVWSF